MTSTKTAVADTELGPPEPAPRPARLRARSRATFGSARRRDTLAIALFVLPGLVLFLLLVVTPIVIAAYTSFYKWNGFGPPTDYIGLGNFDRMIHDEVWTGDLWRGFVIIALSLILQIPASLALAMLLNQNLRGRSVYRVIFFAPYVLSEVTTAVLFRVVFSPERGFATQIFEKLGMDSIAYGFLSDPKIVLYTMFVVISWKYFGFHMILYLAGRQNIPKELTEAATTDGAGAWQTFWHITLPLLGPTIRVSIFLSIIGAIQLFDMPFALTTGGPIHSSETMAVTMYNYGFIRFQIGYATAISIGMFIICLAFALTYQRFVMRRDIEGALTTMGDRR
jgi:raffinose/stachyose/melibiose transport system permease protein